jgi:NADH-quinone oxidoreductase subunit L
MNKILQLIWLVPLFPLVGFLINGLGRKSLSKSAIGFVGSASILASFVVSILIFLQVKAGNTGVVRLFDFISYDKISIPFAFQVDQLSSLFLLIITGVGFLIHVYSTSYMHEEETEHYGRYFSYLNLFVFSMLLLVLGSNYLIMFIGWEGVGLCSYLLIGFWFKNNEYNNAAKKAFVMNRIGDLAFLIAIFWLLAKIGTVNYQDVFSQVNALSKRDLTIITMLFFIGATGKSAQIPLYTWLPDAMAGPTPVSALIHAATMVTAGIYMIARSNILYTLAPYTHTVIAIVGITTAIFTATIALKQNDIKKVLAYSTVSQLGYMFLGLGVGAYTGAVFHVMTHAFFKALLFLGAGSVIHALGGQQDMRYMGGLKKYMPVTHITFLLGCLAIAGIPPFSGFFSKDEILSISYEAHPAYFIVGVLGALMTAYYMFRLYATTFLGQFRGTEHEQHHLHESPIAITVPLIVLAILAVIAGFAGIPALFAENSHALANFLQPIFEASNKVHEMHTPDHNTEWMLLGVSVAVAVIGVVAGLVKFRKSPELQEPTGLGAVLQHKWYVDELYDAVIVRPLNAFSGFLNRVIERSIVDGVVNGVGKAVQYGSRQVRLVQSGQVGAYILLMVASIIIFFIIEFLGAKK